MIKVLLDAGHYGYYNQSPVVPRYYESIQMWKLHLLLQKHLQKYGFLVDLTRLNQKKDLEVTRRGKLAKGYDLFLSLHSNAVGGNGAESMDRVDVYYAYDDYNGASKLGKILANAVAECMGIKKAYAKIRKSEKGDWDYYGVLRGARSVGCPLYYIIEHSFHTNKRSAKWLLKDENLEKLAIVEAKVIAEYFGVLLVGDVNSDGVINKKDYTLAKRIALGTYEPSKQEAQLSDVNSDSQIDKKDYALLKRKTLQ